MTDMPDETRRTLAEALMAESVQEAFELVRFAATIDPEGQVMIDALQNPEIHAVFNTGVVSGITACLTVLARHGILEGPPR